MRNKRRWVAWLILMEAVLLAGLAGLFFINRTELIIRYDILTADRLISILY